MKRASLAALAALLLLLPACGAPEPEPTPTPTPTPVATPTPEPTPTPYNGPVSPLSGLPMGALGSGCHHSLNLEPYK